MARHVDRSIFKSLSKHTSPYRLDRQEGRRAAQKKNNNKITERFDGAHRLRTTSTTFYSESLSLSLSISISLSLRH